MCAHIHTDNIWKQVSLTESRHPTAAL